MWITMSVNTIVREMIVVEMIMQGRDKRRFLASNENVS